MVAIRKWEPPKPRLRGLSLRKDLARSQRRMLSTGEHDAAFGWRVGLVGLSELGDRLGEPFGVRVGRFVFGQKQREQQTKRMPRWFNGAGKSKADSLKKFSYFSRWPDR